MTFEIGIFQRLNRIQLCVVGAMMAMLACCLPPIAHAHEYYLMPESFTPPADQEFSVRHRLGQNFKGNEMPYITKWNIRSEAWKDGSMREVRGQDGDRPAVKLTQSGSGLMSVIHQSNVDFLTFQSWDKFVKYVTKEGLTHALQASRKGRKPKVKLKEGYARYAKTLLALDGALTGEDRPTGLKIELVALQHPLKLAAKEPMPLQLLYDGKPLAGTTVTVFVGVGNDYAHKLLTDRDGKVLIPAEGPGPYLINAIHMTEPQSEVAKAKEAHWESFWASLTFERAR